MEELFGELESDPCDQRLKGIRVAVVGGGLAGLRAARELGRRGIKVTVFEARKEWGGRVLSNTMFSNGRITEEGAELIASFHTRWLALARKYKMTVVSRTDGHLDERAGLSERRTLDRPLSLTEMWSVEKEAAKRALFPIASLAATIEHADLPWRQPALKKFDDMSVATALRKLFKVNPSERVWKQLIFQLVNTEVAPLEEMNFLALLCKVKGAQSVKFRSDGPYAKLMRYWNELEIFRSVDGCQEMAVKMVDEIRTRYGATVLLKTAVTHIDLSKQRVKVGFKKVILPDGTLAPQPPDVFLCDYVILAIPPSVWPGVRITADGEKAQPEAYIGPQGMGPCVKYFSAMKEPFWVKEQAAPYGGSLTVGQVWDGTDNQTRVAGQGIVLSVFAGPIVNGPHGARAPVPSEFDRGLKQLYRGYAGSLDKTLFTDWPNIPFIMRCAPVSARPGP